MVPSDSMLRNGKLVSPFAAPFVSYCRCRLRMWLSLFSISSIPRSANLENSTILDRISTSSRWFTAIFHILSSSEHVRMVVSPSQLIIWTAVGSLNWAAAESRRALLRIIFLFTKSVAIEKDVWTFISSPSRKNSSTSLALLRQAFLYSHSPCTDSRLTSMP